MPIVIEIRSVGRATEVREFLQGRLMLGRVVGNIALGDPQASAKHAEITVTSRGVTFVDLKSTNGSYLENGQRITAPLNWEPDVRILIGSSSLRLVSFERPDYGPSGTLMVSAEPATNKGAAPRETPPPEPLPTGVSSPALRAAAGPQLLSPALSQDARQSPVSKLSMEASAVVAAPKDGLQANVIEHAPPPVSDGVLPSSLGLIVECVRNYRGYAVSGWQVLGPWTIPLGLLSALGSMSELASTVTLVVTSLGYAVLFFFFGWGAHAEFAMRAYAGLPVSSHQIWRLQSRRLVPWLVELLPSLLISFIGCAITLVAFGPMLTPVYMVEGVNGLRINSRSVELLTMNFWLGLVPLGIVLTGAFAVLLAGSTVLQLVPFVGDWLSSLFGPMFVAGVMPFVLFVQFAAYGATRRHREGVDVGDLIRKTLE